MTKKSRKSRSTHGGARPGAGRPAQGDRKEGITDPTEYLRATLADSNESQSRRLSAAKLLHTTQHLEKRQAQRTKGKRELIAERAAAACAPGKRFAPGPPPRWFREGKPGPDEENE